MWCDPVCWQGKNGKIWKNEKKDNFPEPYRGNSLCYTDVFSARLLRNLSGFSFILLFLPDPSRSQLKPSQSFTSHHVPKQSIAILYFPMFPYVSIKQLPRRSKISLGYQCLHNNIQCFFFLLRNWHDYTWLDKLSQWRASPLWFFGFLWVSHQANQNKPWKASMNALLRGCSHV